MPREAHTFTPHTLDAVRILGTGIAVARRERGWTAAELAERVGVSVRTVANLERGAPSVAIGIYFEAATLLGIPLFGAGPGELAALARQGRDRLALLPSRVRRTERPVRDDF